ncbi:hypothetical protein ACIBHX_23750 [Nonomuraea sp. NPDC050536]|uniref:hypothetical protein n=1 Tax=Nonomuraea sp. NPDC050536 TaxID=3364366 RepID=UPI0037C8CB17
MTTVENNLINQITKSDQRVTSLLVDYVTADTIGLTYDMMPGTRPADAGCVVAIWQDKDQIPWDNTAKTQPIGSQQHGSMSFTGLNVQDNSYIIGLSVGPMKTDAQKARNVVASAFVPSPDDPPQLEHDFMTLKFVGPTSVAVQFDCLAGYLAETNLAWMGLWRGEVASYTKPPNWVTPVTIDSNFGTAAFNDVSIGVGLTYTIGFFTSGWSSDPSSRNQKVLASSLTFTQGRG